jgi:hypothetical protein
MGQPGCAAGLERLGFFFGEARAALRGGPRTADRRRAGDERTGPGHPAPAPGACGRCEPTPLRLGLGISRRGRACRWAGHPGP